MKTFQAIALLLLALPFHSYSWNPFENWGIYKDEKELVQGLMPIITVGTSRVNDADIKRLVELLNKRTIDSNLDRQKVIHALMQEIDIKIDQYKEIQKDGPSYSKATEAFAYAAFFATVSGIYLYKEITHDQSKRDIESKLRALGASWVIGGNGSASAYVPLGADERAVKHQLRRLAGLNDLTGVWSLLSGVGALVFGLFAMDQFLDNKYPEYYEKRFEEIKQMITAKLESGE